MPFENYRTTTNLTPLSRPTTIATLNDDQKSLFFRRQHNRIPNRNNNNYAGANRLSDDEYEHDEREGEHIDESNEPENDEQRQQLRRKDNGQIHSQSSMQSNIMGDSFSRNIPSSTFIDSSVRPNPSTSTIMMMMKGNGNSGTGVNLGTSQYQPSRNGVSSYEHRTTIASSIVRPTSSNSSSSSSSLPVDEQQQQHQQQQQQQQQQPHHIKPRGYNFVPPPFNGSRLIAKSTEQLNRSFANDSLVKYCSPSTPSNTSLLSGTTTTTTTTQNDNPASILKKNYLQKYIQPSSIQSPSKNQHK